MESWCAIQSANLRLVAEPFSLMCTLQDFKQDLQVLTIEFLLDHVFADYKDKYEYRGRSWIIHVENRNSFELLMMLIYQNDLGASGFKLLRFDNQCTFHWSEWRNKIF